MCLQKASIAVVTILLSLSPAQTGWTKYEYNPVIVKDTTMQGTWEWFGIGQPSCLFDNDTVKMYYAAAGITGIGDTIIRGRISYACAPNWQTWIKRDPPVPVFDVGEEGTWDSRWLDTPAIIKDSTEYKLYYYGDSVNVVYSALGLATSPDGITWQRYAENPIMERGEFSGWDGFWIESPSVLYDEVTGSYRMWYTGVGYGPGMPSDLWIQIGYATSTDGMNWQKDTVNNPVLETGEPGSWDDGWVGVSAVRHYLGQYEMWYCGASVADWMVDSTLDTGRVGYASSPDGVHWTKYTGNPVLSTFDPPVDTGGPWAPDVLLLGGIAYHMWYETAAGICLATAPGPGVAEYTAERQVTIQVCPNPFRSATEIRIGTGHSAESIELHIYDATGRLVTSFPPTACGLRTALHWDGTDHAGRVLPGGVYFMNAEIGGSRRQANVLFIR